MANSIHAGIDVGSTTTKAVIADDDAIVLASAIAPTGVNSRKTAERLLSEALESCGRSREDLRCTVSTGYGRRLIGFADRVVSEITAIARGASGHGRSHLTNGAMLRTAIDIGGQDSKVIALDESGILRDFIMNDKCAAGTGRFLEVMAKVLNLPLEELGPLSLQAQSAIRINSTCAVFGRSEVTALLRQGKDRASVIAGLHAAVSTRVFTLLRRVGIQPDFAITGGIARNAGVVRRLEELAGVKALLPPEPQIVGALGAALFAVDRMQSA